MGPDNPRRGYRTLVEWFAEISIPLLHTRFLSYRFAANLDIIHSASLPLFSFCLCTTPIRSTWQANAATSLRFSAPLLEFSSFSLRRSLELVSLDGLTNDFRKTRKPVEPNKLSRESDTMLIRTASGSVPQPLRERDLATWLDFEVLG